MNPTHKEWYEQAHVHAGTSAGLLGPMDPEILKARWSGALQLIAKCKTVGQPVPDTILDVGCGYAELLDKLPYGWLYTGIEEVNWIWAEAKKLHPDAFLFNGSLSEYTKIVNENGKRPMYDVVVALGVMATLEEDGIQQFAEDLVCMARKYVIVSYQDASRYKGKFRAFTNEEVMELFATPIDLEDAVVLDTNGDTMNIVLIRLK